jgi:hypothetical protein
MAVSEPPAWEIGADEVRALFALPSGERYHALLSLVCDWEEAWGLRSPDGWVLAGGAAARGAFPLWPHPDFARQCARGPWEDAAPEAVPLDEVFESLLPRLAEEGLQVAAFPDPEGESRIVSPAELRRDLAAELELGA